MSVFAKASAKRSARAAWTGLAIVGVSTLLLTACTSGGTPSSTESEKPADSGDALQVEAGDRDLTLKVGQIAPQSGTLAVLGPPQIAAAQLAVNDINAADLGINVELTLRDEGDSTVDVATGSVTDLLSQDVAAISGAAASATTRNIYEQVTSAGVVLMSPSNTGLDLSSINDNGLYFRTAPSDLLQGEVLGNLVAEDGNSTLGIIYQNDAYGTGFADATKKAFEGAGGEVVAESSFNTGDTNFSTQIGDVTAQNPDAIVIISFDEAKVIIPDLVGSGFPGDKIYLTDGNRLDYSKDFAPGLIKGAKATTPGLDLASLGDFTDRLKEIDPSLTDFTYAAESYDNIVLFALAAYAANKTDGQSIADYLTQISGSTGDGEKVTDFADGAKALAEGKQIDYDGLSGPISFDENGDPQGATIGIYEYNDQNVSERIN
ncbi:ABC transporter substrate-binding protein [Agromyces endophyticus]|uniref:ABC transporter substrate-binding protein n=1 Tax=Agromyces sp. H17E-10 TaxID=2932244 RepID=UPI001FD20836|nr:ABC transporter substrate-binding protein [Agromyces sp. H17E-10]UOQ88297.1 ABC transporter substrate-binding protein [Agromyces sp. H17E-10]